MAEDIHSQITVDAEIHIPKGFTEAALETALIKNNVAELEYRSLTELGATGPAGPAGTTLQSVSVASLNNPVEIKSVIGITQGDIILVFQIVAGDANPFSIYTWDTDARAIDNGPFQMQSTGGVWIQTTNGFMQSECGLDNIDPNNFHGQFFHVHRTGRGYFLHQGAKHQLISRVGYNRSELTGTEVNFFENQDDVYKFKTLTTNTTLSIVNYQMNDTRYLEISSAAGETLTLPSFAKIRGEYITDGTINYMTLQAINPGTLATGTITIVNNSFDAGDDVIINGVSFVLGTDWVAGATIAETAFNICNAISSSGNALIEGKVRTSVSGAVITIIGAIGGTAGNAITMSVVDNATVNFTLSGATLAGGIAGQILVEIHHLDDLTLTSELKNDIGLASSTALKAGGNITINVDDTKFDISDGTGLVVDSYTDPDNVVISSVSWTGLTAITPDFLLTGVATFTSIQKGAFNPSTGMFDGVVVQTENLLTPEQERDSISLGAVAHPFQTNIINTVPIAVFDAAPINQLQDLSSAIGTINISGNIYSPNGVNLSINKSGGTSFSMGSNTQNNRKDPNTVVNAATVAGSFFYNHQDGSGGFTATGPFTVIDPANYDDGSGTLASVGVNQFTIQRIFPTQDTAVIIQYGQALYSSIADAEASLTTEVFNKNPALSALPIRAWLIVKGNATDLSDVGDAKFIAAGKFGEGATGGATSSTTTLQQAYANSIEPEIKTNATQGAFTLQDADTPTGLDLFEIKSSMAAKTLVASGLTETKFEHQAFALTNTLADGANIATNCALGNVHEVTLAGNRTLDNPTNLADGATYIWRLNQDGTGTRTLAFGSAFNFAGGTVPTLSTAPSSRDILTGVSDGTIIDCSLALDFK